MYLNFLDDDSTAAATTATTTAQDMAATAPAGQPPPPMRQPRWYPRQQWQRHPRPQASQRQSSNGPQFYDAQMAQAAQQQQQQAAQPVAQPPAQSPGWMSFLPQIAIGVGAALIVGMMTGKK